MKHKRLSIVLFALTAMVLIGAEVLPSKAPPLPPTGQPSAASLAPHAIQEPTIVLSDVDGVTVSVRTNSSGHREILVSGGMPSSKTPPVKPSASPPNWLGSEHSLGVIDVQAVTNAVGQIKVSWSYNAVDLPGVTFPVQKGRASDFPVSWTTVATVTNATEIILLAAQELEFIRVLTWSPFHKKFASDPSNPVRSEALPKTVTASIELWP
jgi:hypothetical protein